MDNSFLYSKKILLVDDEPDLLKMAADILKDAGFETVLTAPGAKEAAKTAKQEKPDLIILDVMLPDGDGFSLMKQLCTFTDVRQKMKPQINWPDWALGQMIIFLSPLCPRNCCCGSMPSCAALIKRTARRLTWMDVRLILAGQKSEKAAGLSP